MNRRRQGDRLAAWLSSSNGGKRACRHSPERRSLASSDIYRSICQGRRRLGICTAFCCRNIWTLAAAIFLRSWPKEIWDVYCSLARSLCRLCFFWRPSERRNCVRDSSSRSAAAGRSEEERKDPPLSVDAVADGKNKDNFSTEIDKNPFVADRNSPPGRGRPFMNLREYVVYS